MDESEELGSKIVCIFSKHFHFASLLLQPTISHLKRNRALILNLLKGLTGDIHKAFLSGIDYDLKLLFN